MISFSILCDLYRNEANGTNPFLPFFLEAIETGTDPVERQYLVHLLCSPPTNRNVSRVCPCHMCLSSSFHPGPNRLTWLRSLLVYRHVRFHW